MSATTLYDLMCFSGTVSIHTVCQIPETRV